MRSSGAKGRLAPGLEFLAAHRRPIAAAVLLALVALPWALSGEAAAEGSSASTAAGVEADTATLQRPRLGLEQQRAARERSAALLAGTDELSRKLETAIANGVAAARHHSDGRAHGNNISVALSVRDASNGALLVGRRDEVAQRPASVLKLVTTAAALVHLGTRADFETLVELGGPVRSGVLQGDLVLRAGADPFYDLDAEGRVEARVVAPVLAALREAGVRSIEGAIVLDEASYLAPGPGPEWPPSETWWQTSCALSGGFSVNAGLLSARVTPGRSGGPASLVVHPVPHGLRENYGVETVSGGANDVRVGANSSGVTVGGRIGAERSPWSGTFSHPDPVEHFGEVLLGGLERAGLAPSEGLRRERDVAAGTPLCTLRSPIAATLIPINQHSANAVADQLFLAMAARVSGAGTREAGAQATARALDALGVSSAGLVQVDGSGLSRANRVTAAQVSALIAAVLQSEPAGSQRWFDSLAVAGESGTLAERMLDSPARGRVRAKTGWIRGTTGLAGVAETLAGDLLVFALLIEYPAELGGLNTHAFKPMGDAVARVLVEYGS